MQCCLPLILASEIQQYVCITTDLIAQMHIVMWLIDMLMCLLNEFLPCCVGLGAEDAPHMVISDIYKKLPD